MLGLIIFVIMAMTMIEIFFIIVVGNLLGPWLTVGLLALVSIVGGVLLRGEGMRAWRRVKDDFSRGILPEKPAVDGLLILFGGTLMLTPGFVTDAVGLLCMFPPTRVLARTMLLRRWQGRFQQWS